MENNDLIKRKLTFEFKGDGFEYFKIWIVNVLLSIITLGIYSPWAKVRNNRYFYANTYLDNDHFQYLAKPITILKGRLIAVAFFILYSVVAGIYPLAALVFALILFFAIPYLVNKSMAFTHRMSAYKNIQFRFKASYSDAFKVIYIWPVIGFLTLGIMYPQTIRKMHLYKATNSTYGTTPFEFDASYEDYAMKFLFMLGIAVLFIVPAWAIATYAPSVAFISPIMMSFAYAAIILYFIVSIGNLFFAHLTIADHAFESTFSIPSLAVVMLKNIIFTVLTLGLYLPVAKVNIAKYTCDHLVLKATGSLDTFVAAEKVTITALGEEFGEVFDFGI